MSDPFVSWAEIYTLDDGAPDTTIRAILDGHQGLHRDVPELMGSAVRLSGSTAERARTVLVLLVARSEAALQRGLRHERVADLRRALHAQSDHGVAGVYELTPEEDWWQPNVRDIWTDLPSVVAPVHTALVVVDIQNDFCSVGGKRSAGLATNFEAVRETLVTVIEAARSAGVAVVYTQSQTDDAHDHGAVLARRRRVGLGDGYLVPGTWGWELCDFIAPRSDEEVVEKWRHSAFSNPRMDAVLRDAGAKSVVVTGVATNGCIEGFVRDAFARGYYTTVLEDCVATFDDDLQAHSLRNMHMHFADLTTSADVLRAWGTDLPQ